MFFGGARGGGKTDGVLGHWALKEARYGSDFNAMMFRKSLVASEDAIERSKDIYNKLGARFANDAWRMPNGGRVGFGYLDALKDADAWQGRNLTDVWIEEVGLYADPALIWRMFGVLRSAGGVPVQMILTGNPGGPGQHWIRARYELHPFPRSPRLLRRPLPNGTDHLVAVIPSRIRDNQILLNSDPGYVNRLHLVGKPALVKAWLDGDWTAVEGAFFDCWSDRNIVPPFTVPDTWLRFRSADWGSASPFSIGWWAVVQEEFFLPDFRMLPKGALVRYREWYGSTDPGSSAMGLKLAAEKVGKGIAERERNDPKLAYGVMDPATFKQDGGPSIAERINRVLTGDKCVAFRAADNTRVAAQHSKDRRGPMSGWDQMRSRIEGEDGVPMAYCFETCVASIRTIPVLQHDPARAEDLDTTSEDHAADDWRYACSSRPWTRKIEVPVSHTVGYQAPRARLENDITSSVKLS